MSIALTVAIVAGCVSLLSTIIAVAGVVFTGLNARTIEKVKAATEADRVAKNQAREMAIYSAPLSGAAFDLQSRFYNMLEKDFARAYMNGDSSRACIYGVNSTIFLIAQFFCWSELTRTGMHYITLDSDELTQKLSRLQDRMRKELAADHFAPILRIFAGEQRAIGEALIVGPPKYTTCMGYGAFLTSFPKGANRFIDELRLDVEQLSFQLEIARPRLVQLQHTLVEILELFDPKAVRFPRESRSWA